MHKHSSPMMQLTERVAAFRLRRLLDEFLPLMGSLPFGWERYVGLEGAIIGTADFGASAPGPVVMREFGFTAEHIVETAKALLKRSEGTVSQ
jgi:transketolase